MAIETEELPYHACLVLNNQNNMKRMLALLYGIICYTIFFATFLWMIVFLGDFEAYAPTSVNSGITGSMPEALLINVGLILLFGLQHTVMARKSFKEKWTKFVPQQVERSTYVLFSSVVLAGLFWFWQPITVIVWQVDITWLSLILKGGFWLGWFLVLLSTFLISHFNLFGLKQVYDNWKSNEPKSPSFMEPGLYKYVRHPLMLGFLIAFWSVPTMTVGHLVFSLGMTIYILVGVYFEEKTMMREFGDEYQDYKSRVPKFFPGVKRS